MPRLRTKTIGYIPTIDGRPGRWDGRYQICFVTNTFPVKLERNRSSVRRQIDRTVRNRAADNLDNVWKHAILRVTA